MGLNFFDFLDLSSPHVHPLPTFAPTPLSTIHTTHQPTEHDVSFDLTNLCSSRKVPARPPWSRSQAPVALPLEVVLCIIEAAYYNSLEFDEDTLKNCALVCRAWSGISQKLLFSTVTLRTEAACDSFRRAVNRTTARGCMLGNAVIRMRVVIDHNQPYGLSQISFGRAFTLCPNLYELDLALYGCAVPGEDIVGVPDVSRLRRIAPSFDEQTLALLKSGPSITALQFSNWSENQHSVAQLLDLWPMLKSLSISGTPPQPPESFDEMFAGSLEELRVNFQSSLSIDFLNWLLHNSTDTLRILELAREPSAHLLDYLVDTCSATLQSLSVPSCNLNEHARAIQMCHQLKELRVENPGISSKLYRNLPINLEHIAIGMDRNTPLQTVLEMVKTNDSLRVVTVNLWNGGDKNPHFSSLKIACAYQGVDLRITDNIQTFRILTRGDPVSFQSFPRIKSLDNLRIMRS